MRDPQLSLPRRPAADAWPYWQWTAKVDGKTVTRRLSDTEARLNQEWIANDRQLRAIVTQMRQVAAKATELMMREATNTRAKVQSHAERVG